MILSKYDEQNVEYFPDYFTEKEKKIFDHTQYQQWGQIINLLKVKEKH